MASERADDEIPPTPRNSVSSHDTERDLVAPTRTASTQPPEESGAADSSTTLSNSTLLSVKAAADRVSERPDDHRLEELDRRVVQLEARLKVLELSRGLAPTGDRRWLVWVGLMLALILGWQLRAYFSGGR